MSDVPKDARERLISLALERDRLEWVYDLAIRALDLEAAASEAVTEEMVRVAWDAHADGAACEVLANTGQVYAALLAVAPALLLAGERRGLERAADAVQPKYARACDCSGCVCGNTGNAVDVACWDEASANAAAIRALKPGEPA